MAISTRVYNDQAMSTLNRITGDIQNIQSKIATGRNILKASDEGSSPKSQKILQMGSEWPPGLKNQPR